MGSADFRRNGPNLANLCRLRESFAASGEVDSATQFVYFPSSGTSCGRFGQYSQATEGDA